MLLLTSFARWKIAYTRHSRDPLVPPRLFSHPAFTGGVGVALVPLLFAGLGNGAFIAPNTQFIIATADRPEAGAASGVVATAQPVGSAVGIAIIGSVLFDSLTITGPGTLAIGFTHAVAAAMAVSTGLSLAARLLVFTLPKHRDSSLPVRSASPGR